MAKEEIEKIEEIDLVLGTNEKNEIVKIVEEYFKNHIKQSKISDVMKQIEFLDFGSTTYAEKTRAAIKIQDGCDRFCTYCIIPYARGRVRSRKIENVVKEAQEIANTGIKEIIITGIHIASYGKDLEGDITLWNLLYELDKIEGLQRIRLGSLEPTLITDEFVEKLKSLKKLCTHFHLSLQSGCDETLKRMNRKYSIQDFKEVVYRLRSAFSDVVLTTDIIVGFPGETEQEFQTTYEFLKEIKFYKMHVFPYSQRKGTKAAIMPNQVDAKIKEQRSRMLIELSNKNEKNFLEKYIGEKVEVLFEQEENEWIKGHTKNYIEVKVPKTEVNENEIKIVKVQGINELSLTGRTI